MSLELGHIVFILKVLNMACIVNDKKKMPMSYITQGTELWSLEKNSVEDWI